MQEVLSFDNYNNRGEKMKTKVLLIVCIIGLLFGCVTQKPARVYNLTIYISGGENNCVEVHTEAMVDKDEGVSAEQTIQTNVDTGLSPFDGRRTQ